VATFIEFTFRSCSRCLETADYPGHGPEGGDNRPNKPKADPHPQPGAPARSAAAQNPTVRPVVFVFVKVSSFRLGNEDMLLVPLRAKGSVQAPK
jgi:hypothetical protein